MKKEWFIVLLICLYVSIQGLAQKTIDGVRFSACLNGKLPADFYKSKFLVLDFWAPWNGPSIASFPRLDELQQKFKNNTDIIFATMTAGPKAKVDTFFDQNKGVLPGFLHLVDDNRTTGEYYNVQIVPLILVFSPSGKMTFSGRVEQLSQCIDSLLKVK